MKMHEALTAFEVCLYVPYGASHFVTDVRHCYGAMIFLHILWKYV